MNSLIAFALTKEYAGTVDTVDADGNPQTVPKFGGGLLAVGDGDFAVSDHLTNDTITVWASDSPLIEMLDAYPALERVEVPDNPVIVSPYERLPDSALAHTAAIRGIADASTLERDQLLEALHADDVANLAAVANDVDTHQEPAAPAAPPPPVPIGVMDHGQLKEAAGAIGVSKGGSTEELRERVLNATAPTDDDQGA